MISRLIAWSARNLLLVIVGSASFQLARTNAGVAELDGLERGAASARNWVSKTQLNVARSVAIAKASGQPDIENYFSPLIKTTSGEISTLQKSMEELLTSDEGKALLAKVASERAAYLALRNRVFEHVKQADAPAADASSIAPPLTPRPRIAPKKKPLAVASGGHRRIVLSTLKALGICHLFDAIV